MSNEIDKLKTEIIYLKEKIRVEVIGLENSYKELRGENSYLLMENKILKDALKFYADESSLFEVQTDCENCSNSGLMIIENSDFDNLQHEIGETARVALKRITTSGETGERGSVK